MKRKNQKMQHAVQPRQFEPLRNKQVQEEIQNFLHALDSYPARAAKEPRISFQQHLSGFLASAGDDRQGNRFRRR